MADEQTSRGKSRNLHRTYPPHIRSIDPGDIGLRMFWPPRPSIARLMRFVFLGPRLCLRLPSDPASRRRPCLQLGVPVTRAPRGLAPPSCGTCPAQQKQRRASPFGSPFASYGLLSNAASDEDTRCDSSDPRDQPSSFAPAISRRTSSMRARIAPRPAASASASDSVSRASS